VRQLGFRNEMEENVPIYRYKCRACEHELELTQTVKEGEEYKERIKDCPECGESEWRRVMSPSSFQLQGRGWYKNGY
jgi:putative FmdB family regulatory protein